MSNATPRSSTLFRWVGGLGALVLFGCASDDLEARFDRCIPTEAPDTDCYAEKRNPTSDSVALATRIAARFRQSHPPEDLPFDWEVGVMMHGLNELYRVTGEIALRDYADAWFRHHAPDHTIVWSDSCPPGLTALALMGTRNEAPYGPMLTNILEYVDNVVPRTDDGGLSHMGTVFPNTVTLWLDTLFMVGMVLTRYTTQFGNPEPLDEMGRQIDIFADRLQLPSGWFVHAFGWLERPEPIFWARGNSWVTIAVTEYIRARIDRGESSPRAESILAAQVGAVLDTQDESGLWWTVADRPGETYLETSGSALFAYGLARSWRYGLRTETGVLDAIAQAKAGLMTRIDEREDGPVVTGISIGTNPGDFDNYANVAQADDVPFGVGAAILLLVESSGLP